MVGSRRQGWTIFAAMVALFIAGVVVVYIAERHGTPAQHAAGVARRRTWRARSSASASPTPRCGPRSPPSPRAARSTRARVADRHRRARAVRQPVGSARSVFGGVGTGLYSMLLFVLLAVFIGGLMVGRTPEYLGKKIEAARDQARLDRRLFTPLIVLLSSSLALATKYGKPSIFASGPAGLLARRSTPTSRRPTTTARRSPATPASSSPTPATSAPTASRSPTCSAA